MKRLLNPLLPPIILAPDGAGGGGAPPGEFPLEDWITRLNETGKKDRKAVVEELSKALGITTGDAYKKLKEAGWDPKTSSDKNFINKDTPPAAGERPAAGEHPEPEKSKGPDGTQPESSAAAAGGNPPPVPTKDLPPKPAETFSVTLRHKTPHPHYRRAGLLLTNQFKSYTVTAEQRTALKKDAWVEFQEPAGRDKA
jgi:hypothetical protein